MNNALTIFIYFAFAIAACFFLAAWWRAKEEEKRSYVKSYGPTLFLTGALFFGFFGFTQLFETNTYHNATRFELPSQAWDRHHLGDFVSEDGEELSSFLQRTASVIADFTKRTGYEACGAIASNDQKFSLKLFTDSVPHGCAIRTSEVMEGFSFIGETIHSHPHQSILNIDRKARAWSEAYGQRIQADSIRNDGRGGFSKLDLSNAIPGWLVAGGKLHFSGTKDAMKKVYTLP